MKEPRFLFYDIETAPLLAAIFNRYELHVPYEMVYQEWFIICAAWKWLGEKTIHGAKITDDPNRYSGDYTDDYLVVKALAEVFSKADVIIAHNGDFFDWKKFKTRLKYHKLPMIKKPIMIDTLKLAKEFSFTSNKLDDLCTFLGLDNKLKSSSKLWVKAAHGDKKAVRDMFKYNKGDIPPLEQLYTELKPYVEAVPNMNLWRRDESCPGCGSSHYHKKKDYVTAARRYAGYQCQDCGRYFKGKKPIMKKDFR